MIALGKKIVNNLLEVSDDNSKVTYFFTTAELFFSASFIDVLYQQP